MKINCPHCKQHLDAPGELAGKSINCPSCNGLLLVPIPTASIAESSNKKVEKQIYIQQAPPKSGFSILRVILLVIGIIGVLPLLTVLFGIIGFIVAIVFIFLILLAK